MNSYLKATTLDFLIWYYSFMVISLLKRELSVNPIDLLSRVIPTIFCLRFWKIWKMVYMKFVLKIYLILMVSSCIIYRISVSSAYIRNSSYLSS